MTDSTRNSDPDDHTGSQNPLDWDDLKTRANDVTDVEIPSGIDIVKTDADIAAMMESTRSTLHDLIKQGHVVRPGLKRIGGLPPRPVFRWLSSDDAEPDKHTGMSNLWQLINQFPDAVWEKWLLPDGRQFVREQQEYEREMLRATVRERVQRDRRAGLFVPPETSGDLAEQLARPRPTYLYLVEGMIGERHNASLTAQYKTGKTTFGLNCSGALVDGRPFLGRETHLPGGGTVGWWNAEMEQSDFLNYVDVMGVVNSARILPLHMRGQRLSILDDIAAEWVVKWLRDHDVAVWVMDSWRRLCTWAGVKENDNTGVDSLTDRVDEIKREAGVAVFIPLVHTGRAQQEEGAEHARGATALDDWVDARIVLTRQRGTRFMYAEGRGVAVEEVALTFDPATNLLGVGGGGGRRDARVAGDVGHVVTAVTQREGMNATELRAALRSLGVTNTDAQTAAIDSALHEGLINRRPAPRGNAQLHYLGPSAQQRWAQEHGGAGGGETVSTSDRTWEL